MTPRVCFYAPLLYPLWSDGRVPFTGGAEVQQAMLATELARRGFEVTVVTCDFGQPSTFVRDGVTVRSAFRLDQGVPVVRFFYPRLWKAWAALGAAAADVYYVRGASLEAGVAYEAARARDAAFVFGAAHDHDALRSLPLLTNPRERWWYRRALRGAGAVIAQTEAQRALFEREYGVRSDVVRNAVEIPAAPADAGGDGAMLWLATYKPSKRPDRFVELARAIPERRFVMAGVVDRTRESREAFERAGRAAAQIGNLTVRGYVGRDQIGGLFRDASLFVHTSTAEGFPNAVLEAWAHGLPAVTCFDPDGVIVREGLGATAASHEDLVREVRRFAGDPALRREAGARARAYVVREHGVEATAGRFAGIVGELAARTRAAGRARS